VRVFRKIVEQVLLLNFREMLTTQLTPMYAYGFATGGVSTLGGRSFGFAGVAADPGAGRTSIGGGNGATCWVATGCDAEGWGATGCGEDCGPVAGREGTAFAFG